ncbi:hypothetical protein STCU_00386 [Strigomonas culicis]|uniref:Uncharacterized protein n=1 Tax=Strigomonas culicis TaxID=28005 RepID=S9V6X2_9TRYP|nr:hypothetical protein STCU_09237 [Strigomonas culicis]EPY21273.1 hypothetical protein STCU_08625 [Strigomonas culicis]EPY29364.1 hypothetical protein STCU_04593 [Strigomonas culicis]EPY33870.1 hypothetical protein STCU_01896 [Strigomonas culicis]EPY36829.1 hypothetical protein STCU_00386 [Strigomonas culicis]|eukprot:EPY19921.1 hypothetical protein STCU_09237 [Strigomonas culicis]
MWQVIRRQQGLDLNESPYAACTPIQAYGAHQQTILLHETRANIPYIDPKIYTKAYGDFNFEKMHRWLEEADSNLRLQAINELIDVYVERREYGVQSLSYGYLPLLLSLLSSDKVSDMRERAGTALEILLRERAAQLALLELEAKGQKPLSVLLEALQDSFDGVVVITLRALISCHSAYNGFLITDKLVSLGAVGSYIELVKGQNTVVQAAACAALIAVLDLPDAVAPFLSLGGLQAATAALTTGDVTVVAQGAELISKATETTQARKEALACSSIATLAPYLPHDNLSVRVPVAAALAQITILEDARSQAVKDHLPATVLDLMQTEDERDVVVHVARLMTHLGEYPAGRAALKAGVPRLQDLLNLVEEDPAVAVALQTAIDTLSKK